MTDYNWEDVVTPAGSYIGWGDHPGQFVTGKVLSFDPTGATDFNDDVCPLLTLELIEPAASFNKQGERTDYPAGELVNLTCGLVSLKRAIRAADPAPGDVVKITLADLVKTSRGTVKEMAIKIARGAAPEVRRQSAPQQGFGQAPAQQGFGQAPAAAPAANPFAQPSQPANPPF